MSINIVGIDSGLVNTGCVRVGFDRKWRTIRREYLLVDGPDMHAVAGWIRLHDDITDLIVVEKYRTRTKLSSDPEMIRAEQEIKRLIPGAVLLENMGIRKVIPQGLMQVLGLWDSPVPTHHQDLRSAARIMLKGMVRDPGYNEVVADVVLAHLKGDDWTIEPWVDGACNA